MARMLIEPIKIRFSIPEDGKEIDNLKAVDDWLDGKIDDEQLKDRIYIGGDR